MAEEVLRLGIDPQAAKRGAREFERAAGRVSKSANEATGSVRRTETGFDSLRSAAFSLQGAMAAIGLGSTTLLFGRTIRASVEFEQAMTGVAKTVDASAATLHVMGEELKAMSEEIPVSATALAGVAEAAGQLGIQTDAIVDFTRVMAALGVSTNLSAEEAAIGLARFANVMQSSQEDFDRMGASVVALGNDLETTESEILEFATRMAGAGQIAGLTEADVFGVAAALSSVGIEAEAGGTAVQKVLIDINTAVAQGNDSLALFAQTAGMSADAFAAQWETNAGGAFTAFVEGLGRAGDDATTILENLGLNNQRLVRAFLSLGNAGGKLREAIELGNAAWEENTALTEEAQKFYDTLGSDLKELANQAKNLAAEFGMAFGDTIRSGAEKLSDVMSALSKNMDKVTDGAAAFATAVGATVGAVGVTALWRSGILQLIPAITGLRHAIAFLQLALGPVGWFVAGITALTTAIYAWRRAHDGQAEELRGIGKAAKEAASGLREMTGEQLASMEASLLSDISRKQYRVSHLEEQLNTPGIDDQAREDTAEALKRARAEGVSLARQLSEVRGIMRDMQTMPAIKVVASGEPEAVAGLAGALDTTGLEFGRVVDRVEDLREQLIDLNHDAALAATAEDAKALREQMEGAAAALERASRAANQMMTAGIAGIEMPTPGTVDSGIGDVAAGAKRWRDRMEWFNFTGGADARQVAAYRGMESDREGPPSLMGTAKGLLDGSMGLGDALSALRANFMHLVTVGGPLLALFEVLKGVMAGLKPALDAIREPLRLVGELFGNILAPILESVVVPAMQGLALVVSGVVQGLGWLIEAVGNFIDAILPGNQRLDEFGQNMQDQAENMRRAMRRGTEEVEGFTDALMEATSTIPKSLPLAYLRSRHGSGPDYSGGPTLPMPPVPGGPGGDQFKPAVPGSQVYHITINTSESDGEKLLTSVEDAVRRRKGRGATLTFDNYYRTR